VTGLSPFSIRISFDSDQCNLAKLDSRQEASYQLGCESPPVGGLVSVTGARVA
jgi:hypothetical protein